MTVLISDNQKLKVNKARLIRSANYIVKQQFSKPFELSILLTDPDHIQDINANFRKKNRPTDVLSFAMLDSADQDLPAGQKALLGDVIICPEYIEKDAGSFRRSEKSVEGKRLSPLDLEILRRLIHGILHLFGYDHGNDPELRKMSEREDELLQKVISECW